MSSKMSQDPIEYNTALSSEEKNQFRRSTKKIKKSDNLEDAMEESTMMERDPTEPQMKAMEESPTKYNEQGTDPNNMNIQGEAKPKTGSRFKVISQEVEDVEDLNQEPILELVVTNPTSEETRKESQVSNDHDQQNSKQKNKTKFKKP
ncbi:uncharacterized protein G2W53_018304 [Senna tora]|uniref:Uncharacterized protein n=1 Tax=Senna tora TaxID=362788 RepID=A0A834TVQ0_9FABA|nr:uncharacterized protein G2W53_018304 [Senna tora]